MISIFCGFGGGIARASFALLFFSGPFLHVLFHYYNLYSFSNPYVHRPRKLRLIGRGFALGGKVACLYEIVFFSLGFSVFE